MAQIHQSECLG